MSYGFAPGIMPNQVPNPNVPRGSHDPSFHGSSSASQPNIGWALSRGDSVSSGVSETEIVSQDEIPCQAIFVPADEMPIYGNYGLVSNKFLIKCVVLLVYHIPTKFFVNLLLLYILNSLFVCLKLLTYVPFRRKLMLKIH